MAGACECVEEPSGSIKREGEYKYWYKHLIGTGQSEGLVYTAHNKRARERENSTLVVAHSISY